LVVCEGGAELPHPRGLAETWLHNNRTLAIAMHAVGWMKEVLLGTVCSLVVAAMLTGADSLSV